MTVGGDPFSLDVEEVFTPERMQIRDLGTVKFIGYIDRRDLRFYYDGAEGSCTQKTVAKQKTKF